MKRQYAKITNEKRKLLIENVQANGRKIKEAAIELDIPYENAKAILRVYKKEERSEKQTHRFRLKKGEDRSAVQRIKLKYASNTMPKKVQLIDEVEEKPKMVPQTKVSMQQQRKRLLLKKASSQTIEFTQDFFIKQSTNNLIITVDKSDVNVKSASRPANPITPPSFPISQYFLSR